jgi:hypothetical protein
MQLGWQVEVDGLQAVLGEVQTVQVRARDRTGLPLSQLQAEILLLRPGASLAHARLPLQAAGAGVYVGNLHYLNFSDRAAGRITGLTRFATFWVEGGRIVAPLSVMRFDDTLYRVLGSSLEALGSDSEWMLDSGTYGQRSVRTSRVSGALLSRFALTL